MLKKIKERPVYFLSLAFFAGLVLGLNLTLVHSAEEPAHKYLDYFHKSYQLIREEYVDLPDTKNLFFGAIKGMTEALDDPFSRFLDENAYDELKEVTSGQFVGVGIEVTIQDEEILIISPIDDSPAMKAGIHSGDIIVKIDNTEVKGRNLTQVVNLIKGRPKTKVTLQVKRDGFEQLLDFELERTAIKIKNVDYALIEGSNIGYMKIKNFDSKTAGDTAEAVRYLKQAGAEKFIVDLRYNPGGLLSSAVELSDLFIEKGKIIVSTKGRSGKEDEQIFYSDSDPLVSEELVVLVNKGSASASEIFAGAIRDNKRGKLLGEKTFGKGSVQKTFQLDDNIGMAVTVAKYYTPSGEMIHKKGIAPDYAVEQYMMTPQDVEAVKLIRKDNLLDEFGRKYKEFKEYDEASKFAFRQYLKEREIIVSDEAADGLLKEYLYANKKRPIYDLELDRQLAAAANILKKG